MPLFRAALRLLMLLAALVWGLPVYAAPPRPTASPRPAPPPGVRAVILLIGDGMAGPQIYAARALKGIDTGVPVARLNIDALPIVGTFDNHSEDALVTDSAAAATALATGVRVPSHVISLNAAGEPLPTILEQAHAQGRGTGLVTTVSLSNATPAAFAAHARERAEEHDVAAQYVDKPVVDVLLGGGRGWFLPQGTDGGKRPDGRNLEEELRQKGWAALSDRGALLADRGSTRLLGLFDDNAMAYEIDRDRGKQPSLAEMTEAALRSLSRNPKGFFLMVEGGKIDWACHSNDLAAAVRDVLAFDEAVGAALEYQKAHPDTLVIVAGDHETGGLSFPQRFDPKAVKMQQSSVENVLESLPVGDLDPNKVAFLEALRQRLGIEPDVPLREKLKLAQKSPKDLLYVLSGVLTARARANFGTSGHTALAPLLWARGPGQAAFGGSYDITDIYPRLARLLRLGGYKERQGSPEKNPHNRSHT